MASASRPYRLDSERTRQSGHRHFVERKRARTLAIDGRTKYTNQPIYRYRRTAEGDRVANAIWKVAR